MPGRVRQTAGDAAVAIVLLLTTVITDPGIVAPADHAKLAAKLGVPRVEQLVLLWWGATAAMLAALLVRRLVPLAALGLATAGQLLHISAPELPDLPVDVAAPIVLYTVAAYTPRRAVSIAAGTAASVAVTAALLTAAGRAAAMPVFIREWPVLLTVGAWLTGDNIRSRRALHDQVAARARDLEQMQQQRADAAAAAERARIAREMHDVVAHALSVIVIQAQAATGALSRQPGVARRALESITGSGRDALAEMRRLLDADDPGPESGPGLTPLPGIGDLPDLARRVRAAGLPVTLELGDPAAGLPALVSLSVYRIVQEGLTNALKHAGPGACAEVSVRCAPAEVQIRITDTGTGPVRGACGASGANGAPGRGLRGMRERVAMLGGEFSAGPRPGNGFQLDVRLPTGTAP